MIEKKELKNGNKRLFAALVSGLFAIITLFLAPYTAFVVAPFLCPYLGTACSIEEGIPGYLYVTGATILAATSATIGYMIMTSKGLARSLAVIVPSTTLWIPGISIYFAIFRNLESSHWLISPIFGLVGLLVFAGVFALHELLVERLTKLINTTWLVAIGMALIIIYIMSSIALDAVIRFYSAESAINKEVNQVQSLPFGIYKVPDGQDGFFIRVGFMNDGAYLLRYSKNDEADYWLEQQAVSPAYNPPQGCDSQGNSCSKIGDGKNCEIYQTIVEGSSMSIYCRFGGTLLAVVSDDKLDTSVVIKIFDSLELIDEVTVRKAADVRLR